MKLLTLLRHAKSSWKNAQLNDHDRPLNHRGRKDASTMAQRLASRGCIPDLIYCSSAVRTLETAAFVLDTHKLSANRLVIVDDLYLAAASTIQSRLEGTPNSIRHLMLIGHNPGLEEFGKGLDAKVPPRMPTCAVSHFEIDQASFSLKDCCDINLVFNDYPKNLAS